MKEINEHTYTIETAGLGHELVFVPFASCGQIKSGVGFDIGTGGWVISFDDLVAMYELALQIRQTPPTSA